MAVDWHTQEGAEKLAQRIRDYWSARGHTVDVQLHPEAFNMRMRAGWYSIRSNLLNGKPQRRKTILETTQGEAEKNKNKINAIRNRKG